MASASTLPGPALQAAKAALNSALAENQAKTAANGDDIVEGEEGEVQEVDMQQQAENIRTVFNDPKNFNVKVSSRPMS
jgi:translation initiation factor 4E